MWEGLVMARQDGERGFELFTFGRVYRADLLVDAQAAVERELGRSVRREFDFGICYFFTEDKTNPAACAAPVESKADRGCWRVDMLPDDFEPTKAA